MLLGLDIETFSSAKLDWGADAYASHPSTGVHCAVFSLSGEPNQHRIWHWLPGSKLPAWVVRHIEAGKPVLAHNASFEAAVVQHVLSPQFGWPLVRTSQWVDSLSIAASLSLPVSLEMLAKTLHVADLKDEEGSKLMRRLANANVEPTPAELQRLLLYCENDVRAMLACYRRMPKPPAIEVDIMNEDREINARGVYLDRRFAAAMRRMATRREHQIIRRVFDLTNDLLSTAAQPVKRWLQDRGVELPMAKRKRDDGTVEITPTLDRAAMAQMLADPDLDPKVRDLLSARSEASRATSLAKLGRVDAMVGPDGRLRWAMRYCGAHTGRWSSKGYQLHNQPQSRLGGLAEPLRTAVLGEDLQAALKTAPDLMAGLSQLLRSVVAAAPGHELIGGDYSAVEARILAWLAGQEDVLAVFADGRDIYVEDAANIGSDNRQLGKVQRLALGYGMGAIKFRDTAADYGVALDLKQAREIQQRWRKANPAIVQFWRALQDAAAEAVHHRGTEVEVGRVTLVAGKRCLRIRLPSGRCLHYWGPRQRDVIRKIETVDPAGNIVAEEVQMRELQFLTGGGGGMRQQSTYGGKLAENVTQAVARDLLGAAMLRFRGSHYRTVMHVHDSIVSEVEAGTGSVSEFCAVMATNPDWADGLPTEVEGYRSRHFRG